MQFPLDFPSTNRAIIHEVLHLYGLEDRYSNVNYEAWLFGCINQGPVNTFEEFGSTSHVGYEDNIMGAGSGFSINSIQFTNLGTAVLAKLSNEKYNENNIQTIVFSEDATNVDKIDSSVPQNYWDPKNPVINYQNPKPEIEK